MSTCFGKFFFKYLRVSTNQKIFFLGDLITFIWKTRWIYMVEEFINILRVSAISCLFSVSSITGEKTSSFKTIFVNLNICGTLKTNFWFLIRCKSGLWSKFPKNVVLINSLIIKFLIVNKGWFWKVCHWGAENDRFQTL